MLDPTPRLIFLVRCCSLSHSLCLRWAGKGKAYCEMLQLYIKKIEYRVRASIFLSHSFAIARLLSRLGPGRIQDPAFKSASNKVASSPLPLLFFFSQKKVVVLTVRITFLFILLHRQDLILRRILGCSLRREKGVQRPSLRRRGHGRPRSDKRNAEEYARSSPRS